MSALAPVAPAPIAEAAPAPPAMPQTFVVNPPSAAIGSPSFHNPLAIRIGLLAASIGMLLNLMIQFGFAIWMVGAGFFAVFMFSRRTRQQLTIRAGARMGMITGILCFVIFTVLFTISATGGGLHEVRDELQKMTSSDPNIIQVLKMLDTPGGLATFFVTLLVMMFVVVTIFCTAGGALGAKVLEKD